jgi:hypothetical protein
VAAFFASGHAADLIILILAAELVVLAIGRRWAVAAGAVMPGMLLAIALRFALTGAAWPWIATPLALAFPFHVADLARRRGGDRR